MTSARFARAALAVASAAALWFAGKPGSSADEFPLSAAGVRTVVVRCGVTDKTGQKWQGSLEPEAGDGRVLELSGYRFGTGDQTAGNAFQFETRPWIASFKEVNLSPARPGPRPVLPNGILARVKGGPAARFRLDVNGQSYRFALGGLEGGKLVAEAGGNIEIELAPAPVEVSGAQGEADYPALATSGERVAVAWQEYVNGRDRLVWREAAGGAQVIEAPETRYMLRPAAAYDGAGALHIVWAAEVDGNWDLYGWRKGGRIERLTDDPGPDFAPRLAADSTGELWLAWQGFRGGQSDVFLKRLRGGAAVRVSESPANDWEPALAAGPGGAMWVGWDGYRVGNYDIYVRSFRGGAPGPVQQVTRSPRFQAHASLATDPQGRLWVAFDEAEADWGKDNGYLVKDRGNPLYQSRRVRVVRLAPDRAEEPGAAIADAFPLGLPDFLQNPQVSVAPDGSVTMLALQLSFSHRVMEIWATRGVWELAAFTLNGSGWTRHAVLPRSTGPHDIRAAFSGGWAAWQSDGRNFGSTDPKRQTILVAQVPGAGGGEAKLRPFREEPDLAFATHPAERANVAAVRNYRIRAGGKEYRILRGDLHRHTTLSQDGVADGSLWDFYRYMLDASDMDFSTVTDHQGGHNAYNWWLTQKSTDLFHMPGRLSTLHAYERSVPYPNGHRNVVFSGRPGPILPIEREEQQGKKLSADAVLPYLRKYDALAFRHTIANDQGTDWKDHNNELETLVEIFQGHRVSYEHEGGPRCATLEKTYLHRSGYRPLGFLWNALAKGYRLGIQSGSDHCATHMSYSCILAEENSRTGLIEAMRRRHSFGATDNIVMDFRVQADGREALQGDELKAAGRYVLSVNAVGSGPIRRVDVIHNERYAYAVTPTGKSAVKFTFADPAPESGENRYYVRLEQEDGNLAWSSPIWVTR